VVVLAVGIVFFFVVWFILEDFRIVAMAVYVFQEKWKDPIKNSRGSVFIASEWAKAHFNRSH
jgi:hypothetical protein